MNMKNVNQNFLIVNGKRYLLNLLHLLLFHLLFYRQTRITETEKTEFQTETHSNRVAGTSEGHRGGVERVCPSRRG